MVAAALTLMWTGSRTWLVSMGQGLGVQALIGAAASAIQTGWIAEGSAGATIQDRVISAVQGLPFNAAGWTARTMYGQTSGDQHAGAMSDLRGYLPIAVGQMIAVALLMGWRRSDEDSLTDPIRVLIWVLLVVNAACNIQWPWWGQ